jgi:hypothetical protein
MLDAAYAAKYISVARMLFNASEGNPSGIPESYLRHLDHTWCDGSVSLVPLLDKFDCSEEITDLDFEEALEILGKVAPEDWPFASDIEVVDVDALLRIYDEDATPGLEDFNESEHEMSVRVEKVLTHCIESVFGEKVEKVRSAGGGYFGKDGQFGQDETGTFAGTFEYNGSKFDFQIYPDESGWSVSYRLTPESLDSLPPVPPEDGKQVVEDRKVRNRRWG